MEDVKRIISEILEIPESKITNDISPENTPSWDSLNNLRMITALESELGIMFTMVEIESMQCYGDIVSLIASKAG